MFSITPEYNLRLYTERATLPELAVQSRAVPSKPKPGHTSHRNLLHVRAEKWRTLNGVSKFSSAYFIQAVRDYQTRIPDTPCIAAPTTNGCLSRGPDFVMKAAGYKVQPFGSLRPAATARKVGEWVEAVPFVTAQEILHAGFPETRRWQISGDSDRARDVDAVLMKQMQWVNTDCEGTPEGYESTLNPLMVFVQPPWILSAADLEAFVSQTKITKQPDSERHGGGSLKSSQRLWAKIWDACERSNSQWFILTSYEQWVFGVFSAGKTKGFVSPVLDWKSKSPNVLQCLCLWMMSSIGAEGSFRYPETAECITTALNMIPWQDMSANNGVVYFAKEVDSGSENGMKDNDGKRKREKKRLTRDEIGELQLLRDQRMRVLGMEMEEVDNEWREEVSEWSSVDASPWEHDGYCVEMRAQENAMPIVGGILELSSPSGRRTRELEAFAGGEHIQTRLELLKEGILE